jgi:hypothetical protein
MVITIINRICATPPYRYLDRKNLPCVQLQISWVAGSGPDGVALTSLQLLRSTSLRPVGPDFFFCRVINLWLQITWSGYWMNSSRIIFHLSRIFSMDSIL